MQYNPGGIVPITLNTHNRTPGQTRGNTIPGAAGERHYVLRERFQGLAWSAWAGLSVFFGQKKNGGCNATTL